LEDTWLSIDERAEDDDAVPNLIFAVLLPVTKQVFFIFQRTDQHKDVSISC